MNNNIINLKLVIVGDVNVGKSHIFNIYNKLHYISESTIVANYKIKKIIKNSQTIKVNVWDLAGSISFRSIIKNYYLNSDAIIFVFDLTNKQSFDNIPNWYREISENIDMTKIKKTLIGNKSDMFHYNKVSKTDINNLITTYDMIYFETSIKSPESIEIAFNYTINEIQIHEKHKSSDNIIKLEFNNPVSQYECCGIM